MRSMCSEVINLPLLPVAVKLVIDVATDINVLNASHIGVISVREGLVNIEKTGRKKADKRTIVGRVRRQTGCLSFSLNSNFGGLCMKCLLFLQQKRGGVDGILEEIVEERRRGKMSRCWLRVVVDGQPCGRFGSILPGSFRAGPTSARWVHSGGGSRTTTTDPRTTVQRFPGDQSYWRTRPWVEGTGPGTSRIERSRCLYAWKHPPIEPFRCEQYLYAPQLFY